MDDNSEDVYEAEENYYAFLNISTTASFRKFIISVKTLVQFRIVVMKSVRQWENVINDMNIFDEKESKKDLYNDFE